MISAQGLTKYYGDRAAIRDLNFTVEQGEVAGILGRNGAGKTTTLRILSCLLLPSAGKVKIGGLDVLDNPHEIRKKVGFLPEVPPLYMEMTVESFLRFAGELRGMRARDARAQVEEVLEITRTKDVRSEVIGNLSHGYRQRVGIGQAVIHQPAVLILDEPTGGLDPVQIVEMREMIRSLKGRHTILVSSHNLPEISQTCDRLIVIRQGTIRAVGSEDELLSSVACPPLRLHVQGDLEAVQKLLRGLDGVAKVELESSAAGTTPRQEGAAPEQVFRVECSSDLRETLSREIVQAGFGLLQISPAEPELESIFIQLTHSEDGQGATPADRRRGKGDKGGEVVQ